MSLRDRSLWHTALSAALVLPVNCLLSLPALTQSITPSPDGTNTTVQRNNNTYQIQGGTLAGQNLFHSFEQFGLRPGEIAHFLSDPSVSHIFGRVVSGAPSMIDGLIQANPNLYLLNPAGIVFGENASLNVGGDFFATTADRVGFSSGWFNAIGSNDYTALVGKPQQFAFLSEHPGAILNFGDLSSHGDLHLLGGTVVNQGRLSTTGNVTIAAVPGKRLVNLSQTGMLLSLDVPQDSVTAGITPVALPSLLTGSGSDRPMVAPALGQGDLAIAGEIIGQHIDLYAAGQVKALDTNFVTGDTRVVRFSATGENPHQAVFIDRRVDSPETLLFGAEAGTVAQIIKPDEEGIARVTEQLVEISEAVGVLDSVAIVAEGNQGEIWLGNQWIQAENLGDDAGQLQQWGAILAQNADLLLYSCLTALGETGEKFVARLASLTGADVAASVDVTGSANHGSNDGSNDGSNYGGNWDLEHQVGDIEAARPFIDEVVAAWDGKLMAFTVTNGNDSGSNSLREEIANANASSGLDDVMFAPNVTSILLTSGELLVTDDLRISGQGSNVTIKRDSGAGAFRIFNIVAGDVTLDNLTIRNGSVSNLNGGGIQHMGLGTLTLKNTTVSENSGQGTTMRGGGIYSDRGTINLIDSMVSHNSAELRGGGIYNTFGTTNVMDSTISHNSVGFGGGGLASVSGAIAITNSDISHNSADRGGGISTPRANVTITGSTLSNNIGSGVGVAHGTLTISNSTIANNSTRDGGGIEAAHSTVTITGSDLSGNTGKFGGGMVAFNSTIDIDDSTIADNTANIGGGIYAFGQSKLTLTNSTLLNNSASQQGGGIMGRSGATITVQNSDILDNSAVLRGGGIYHQDGDTNITNSTIAGNSAPRGGGIFSNQGQVSWQNAGQLSLTDTIESQSPTAAISLTGTNVELAIPLQSGGADITIDASNNVTALTADATISSSGSTTGGNITILAGNDLKLRNLVSTGFNGDGGDITLISSGGSINTTFGNSAGAINASAFNGNGGDVTIQTAHDATIGSIFAEAPSGVGGTVNITSDRFIRLTNTSTGLLGTTDTSISTAGAIAGGTITLRHGGRGQIPFIVGDAGMNGSVGRLSTGNGAHQMIAPDRAFRFNFSQGGTQILTTPTRQSFPLSQPPVGSRPRPLDPGCALDIVRCFTARIGQQLGATTAFSRETNTFAWSIPGEAIDITGFLPRPEAGIAAIDLALANEYQAHLLPDDIVNRVGQDFNLATLRENLSRIEAQTQTRPVLVYALSYPDALELLLITPQADEPIIRKTIPQAPKVVLQDNVRRFRRTVQTPSSDRYLTAAQQLHDWLIAPLQTELDAHNVDTLIFAMSDGLRTLPLAALHDGDRFLIEQYSLGIIPSVSLMNSTYEPLHDSPVLAMGASEFKTLAPLPAVPLELETIAPNSDAGQSYLNADFTLANLRTESRSAEYDVVHLATHAVFQTDQAYIQLWDQQIGFPDLRALDWHDNTPIELLVLSACDTTLGSYEAELGFAGLAVKTGVKSVLASLWQVSDLGTLGLMSQFYDQVRDPNITIKAEALRQAQLDLLRGDFSFKAGTFNGKSLPPELVRYRNTDLSHPFYWSGFTMVGSPW